MVPTQGAIVTGRVASARDAAPVQRSTDMLAGSDGWGATATARYRVHDDAPRPAVRARSSSAAMAVAATTMNAMHTSQPTSASVTPNSPYRRL